MAVNACSPIKYGSRHDSTYSSIAILAQYAKIRVTTFINVVSLFFLFLMAKDPHAQALNIFHDILDRLEELVSVYADMNTDDDEGDATEQTMDILEEVVQEAGERGLDENGADRLFKAISAYAQKASSI